MTTPSPAARSGAPVPKRMSRRQVALWAVFLGLLATGLVLAALFGPGVSGLVDQP